MKRIAVNDNENPAPLHRAFRWLFQDRETGAIVIAQWPNTPFWIFLAAMLAEKFVHPPGTLGAIVSGIATLALTFWALDELVRGVCPWRRFLGAAVLIGEVVTWTGL